MRRSPYNIFQSNYLWFAIAFKRLSSLDPTTFSTYNKENISVTNSVCQISFVDGLVAWGWGDISKYVTRIEIRFELSLNDYTTIRYNEVKPALVAS